MLQPCLEAEGSDPWLTPHVNAGQRVGSAQSLIARRANLTCVSDEQLTCASETLAASRRERCWTPRPERGVLARCPNDLHVAELGFCGMSGHWHADCVRIA